jgi:uncharacterized delta-60 repeat protein
MWKHYAFRLLIASAVALLIALPTTQASQAAAGSLDCTFDNWGWSSPSLPAGVTYSTGSQGFNVYSSGDQSGKLAWAGMSGSYPNQKFLVLRLNSDGTLDTTFGGDGYANLVNWSGRDNHPTAVAALSDGKVVVSGYSILSGNDIRLAMARFNADGTLDTSFDSDGLVLLKIGDDSYITSWDDMVVDSSGNIYVAGGITESSIQKATVVKLNSNGSLAGTWKVDFSGGVGDIFHAIALQSDGKIVAGGETNVSGSRQFALARFQTDGSLDTTFSGDGLFTYGYSTYDIVYALGIQSDGKVVAGGMSGTSGVNYDFAVLRLTTGGGLDTTFSSDGIDVRDLNGINDSPRDLLVQSNDQIVIAGYAMKPSSTMDFVALRYTSSGSLDSNFGASGVLWLDYANNWDNGYDIEQQPDGKLVMSGYVSGGGSGIGFVRIHDTDIPRRYGIARVTQNTSDIEPGVEGDLLRAQVCMEGDAGPNPTVTGFQFSTNGTTNAADIDSAQVYFTGSSSTFDTASPFGSAIANPSGTFTASGSQALNSRISYFWLAYTIGAEAPIDGSHVADAEINTITVDSNDYTPPVASPSGTRRIYKNYPPIIGDTSYGDEIQRVTFNTIDNISGADGYGDYTAITTTIQKGSAYTLQVVAHASPDGSDYLSAFIDWNHDYDFDDAGEEFQMMGDFDATVTAGQNITVPEDATPGLTRMRIALLWEMWPLSGEMDMTNWGGEAEDYSVMIVGSPTRVSLSDFGARSNQAAPTTWVDLSLAAFAGLALAWQRRRKVWQD